MNASQSSLAGQSQSQSQSNGAQANNLLDNYDGVGFYDEAFDNEQLPRSRCRSLYDAISQLTAEDIHRRQQAAVRSMLRLGITFNVYGDEDGTERIIPFDIAAHDRRTPNGNGSSAAARSASARSTCSSTTSTIARRFCKTAIPDHVILSAKSFRQQCVGLNPPQGIWCHITGTDLVRDGDGQIYVLEDNLRCPSGVSYVLENRQLMKRTFPQVFERATMCCRSTTIAASCSTRCNI